MNIYEKLQNMRVELQQKNIKKSGKNKFAGYEYYELSDILPPINELQSKYKTCSFIKFSKEEAILTLINSEKPDEKIELSSPMAELTLKGTHPIQNLGGIETYQRRYLYMAAFEIVENDYFDSIQGKEQQSQSKKTTIHQNQSNHKAAVLSPEVSDMMNKGICNLKNKFGIKIEQILKDIEATTGIKKADINDSNAPKVFNAIGRLEQKYKSETNQAANY